MLPIHHCLLSRGGSPGTVSVVYAHSQALAQCAEWLSHHVPKGQRVPVSSNAEAARRAAEETGAGAIASEGAAELYGLDVLARNIEDEPSNTTRFLVIGDQDPGPSGRDKTSLAMSAPNRPGGLVQMLEPLARHGLSMSRLESRPSRTGLWEYVFFLDLEGHRQDAALAAALAELREISAFLKILGSYPVAPSSP